MSFRLSLKFVLLLFIGASSLAMFAQQTGSTVRGVVADPDNAVIPGATVTLTPSSGKAFTTESQADGSYVVSNVPAGIYSITVTMNGFSTFVRQGVRIAAGQPLSINAKMAIQDQEQTVQVTAQSNQLSVDQDNNASATVIKGKDLEALSDDPDELSSELTALAGPAAGPNGGQVYIDGFTGGQLPPKSSIREIRINQNPFSAEYDKLGYGRVEVFTKPGTDKLHGSFQTNGNDSAFNTGNPLLNGTGVTEPPYHTIYTFGNVTGPLTSFASFTLGGSYRSIQDNALVNGTILAPTAGSTTICDPGDVTCVQTPYVQTIGVPQSRKDISPRIDLALGQKNTLTARYRYEQNVENNNGIGSLVAAEAGNNSTTAENTVQISDTQVVSTRLINETRFEFQRDTTSQTALSTKPSISVQGSFTAGGSSTGSESDVQNHYEVQNYTSLQLKKNFIRMGGRLRVTTEDNTTTAGSNGIFTYNCLIASSDCTSAFQSNAPSQFSITANNHPSNASTVDLGIYAEDDWKPKPNLTISYGLRYETQNFIHDHRDFAPRLSFAYGLGSSKGTPKTVLRGGFGIFYDRFQLTNQIMTAQQNGINQVTETAVAPQAGCSPTNIQLCLGGATASGNTTYTIAPNLRAPYTLQFAIGADQQLFRGATLSVNYLNAHGIHQFISENVNAPIDGVYPTAPGANGEEAIAKQFQSEGIFRQNELITNINVRTNRMSLFGYYVLNFANSDSAGAASFPSVPNNIGADYGRATFAIRNRVFLGGNYTAPYFISVSPFIIASSGTPYNITTGTDVNGDSIYNDRPEFQPGMTSGSCTNKNDFVTPARGTTSYTPIPINYCTGPAEFTMNLRVSKTIGFGALTAAAAARKAQQNGGPGGGGPGGGHGRGGGGGGGGRGPGGFGGANTGHRYNLAMGAQFQNLFNYADRSAPSGTLTSPQFGTSTQLAGGPYTSNSAVQRIQLFASFNF